MSLEEYAGAVVTSVPLPLSANPVPLSFGAMLYCYNGSSLGAAQYFGDFGLTLDGIRVRKVQYHYQFSPSGPQICPFPLLLRPKKNRYVRKAEEEMEE